MTDREFLVNLKSMLDAQLQNNGIPVAQPNVPPADTPASHLSPFALSILTAGHENQPAQTTVTTPPASADYLFTDFDFRALNGPRLFDNTHDRHSVTPTDDVELLVRVTKHDGNEADFVAVSVADPRGSIARSDKIPVNAEGSLFSFDAKGGTTYTIIVISPEKFSVAIYLEARSLG